MNAIYNQLFIVRSNPIDTNDKKHTGNCVLHTHKNTITISLERSESVLLEPRTQETVKRRKLNKNMSSTDRPSCNSIWLYIDQQPTEQPTPLLPNNKKEFV